MCLSDVLGDFIPICLSKYLVITIYTGLAELSSIKTSLEPFTYSTAQDANEVLTVISLNAFERGFVSKAD